MDRTRISSTDTFGVKKPAYESPIVVNLNDVPEGKGGSYCENGSGETFNCRNGAVAGPKCNFGGLGIQD